MSRTLLGLDQVSNALLRFAVQASVQPLHEPATVDLFAVADRHRLGLRRDDLGPAHEPHRLSALTSIDIYGAGHRHRWLARKDLRPLFDAVNLDHSSTRDKELGPLDILTERMSSWIDEISESDSRTSYEATTILANTQTAVCESVVIATSPAYGRMLFLEGELQSASADEHMYHEALVHPVMSGLSMAGYHHDAGLHILVVGGGEGATVREVLKWGPERVDWIDIDGELVDLCEEHLGYAAGVRSHHAVHYQAVDIRDALPNLNFYDAIILDLPDPDGATGYLYSEDFWSAIRFHLVPGGRIVTHCGPVRPFGHVGAGFQRMLDVSAVPFDPRGFYSQSIPSFQGEWGFWMWNGVETDPFAFLSQPYLPVNPVRVADRDQIRAWGRPSLLWRSAVAYAVNNHGVSIAPE